MFWLKSEIKKNNNFYKRAKKRKIRNQNNEDQIEKHNTINLDRHVSLGDWDHPICHCLNNCFLNYYDFFKKHLGRVFTSHQDCIWINKINQFNSGYSSAV